MREPSMCVCLRVDEPPHPQAEGLRVGGGAPLLPLRGDFCIINEC